jgi:hypothetical protein
MHPRLAAYFLLPHILLISSHSTLMISGQLTVTLQVRELLSQETIKLFRPRQQLPDLLSTIFTQWLLKGRSLCLQMMTPPPVLQPGVLEVYSQSLSFDGGVHELDPYLIHIDTHEMFLNLLQSQ